MYDDSGSSTESVMYLTLLAVGVEFTTPAGVFDDCVILGYRSVLEPCPDAYVDGYLVWARDVGQIFVRLWRGETMEVLGFEVLADILD